MTNVFDSPQESFYNELTKKTKSKGEKNDQASRGDGFGILAHPDGFVCRQNLS